MTPSEGPSLLDYQLISWNHGYRLIVIQLIMKGFESFSTATYYN